MPDKSKTTALDHFHSDELRAELARRDAICKEAVQTMADLMVVYRARIRGNAVLTRINEALS